MGVMKIRDRVTEVVKEGEAAIEELDTLKYVNVVGRLHRFGKRNPIMRNLARNSIHSLHLRLRNHVLEDL